ncbi:unnamed protein product [Mytilus edulis]|uniref:Uncharacterized protein n=1 Tax=Mytilus edulis TaxID=6550 RepID=A0A8S3SF81_MYTED|nr:unnamed protein product [Mytilus edulis]
MCTTDYATEDNSNGGTTVDSVVLRVMTQQDGCTCEVTLQNQNAKFYTLQMRKYDLAQPAAPDFEECGLAIDIEYIIPNNLEETKEPVECTKGTADRFISLSKNETLHFRSRIIGGNFSIGYCMQIYRPKINGDKTSVHIHCTDPNMTTTQHLFDTTISENIADDTDSVLFIVIGVGSGFMVIALFIVVAIIIIRRKVNKNKNGTDVQPDNESTDYDSDGLKFNTLYNASEQQETMEGDYHTVELEGTQIRTGTQNLGTDYSAVDGNYSSVDIINVHPKDSSKTDSKIRLTSNTTPRSVIQQNEEEMDNTVNHVTPIAGSNVEYAVVDKRGITDKNVKHVTAPNDSNVEYAVIDKQKVH